MATSQEIAELRIEIREPNNAEPYTDDFLGGLIDSYGITESAHKVWIAKRNSVAALVDISEGGSSRKMSQVFDNYQKIVAGYEDDSTGVDDPEHYAPRTRKVERI
jgi:hypothetical protein